jgi:Flp pilus assembly pilin Flp
MSKFWLFLRRQDGATAVEYAVMIGLIIAVCIGAITLVGGGTYDFWQNNRQQLEARFSGS